MRHFTPRPYQEIMVNHIMDNKRCALFVPMGMGKSAATLMALENLNLTHHVYPALIMAPLRVARSTWKEECAKWAEFSHIKISTIIGDPKERMAALKQEADIYTVNYENLQWLEKTLQDNWPFKTVIADESTKLKSFRTRQGGKRVGVLRRYAFTKVSRWVNLTGTPAPNGMQDLWGSCWFLDMGERLGRTFSAFSNRWFKTGYDGYSLEILSGAQAEIEGKIKDVCLSLNAADYFDIKEPKVTPVFVKLDSLTRNLYTEMEKRFFIQVEEHGVEAFNAASKSGKLLQLCNGAVYVDHEADGDNHPKAKEWKVVHDEKLKALEDIIEEAAGMPVLVAYNFKSDLVRLKKHFPHGRHIATKKDEDDFKAGNIDLAFVHPASIGHGVDGFQYVTNIIVFFGLTWNLENYQQIIERIGPVRQIQAGFNRVVFVYLIVARDTIDEDVLTRLETKRSVQDILLEAMNRRGRA